MGELGRFRDRGEQQDRRLKTVDPNIAGSSYWWSIVFGMKPASEGLISHAVPGHGICVT